MYTSTILASVAMMASTALASTGSAHIINACTYPVYFKPIPAQGGGYDVPSETTTLAANGGSWTQQWTSLSNKAGWSLKLAKDEGTTFQSNILQYEYTFQNDGTIWYDLSCVDGNPWDGNWEVSASGDSSCLPKQSFYRFATDDAYGMQSCPSDSSITVTLCSGESQAESLVSSIISAVVAPASTTSTSSTTQTTPTTTSTTTPAPAATTTNTHGHALGFQSAHFFNAAENVATVATPTTFATSTTAVAVNADGYVVTVVETVVETAVAYETYVPGKRHVHHPEHPLHR